MTDLFKCKKQGTQCCAPKSKVQEYQLRRNDTMPYPNVQYPHLNVYATPVPPPLQYTSFSYESQQTTTTPRPPVYSKYVCGVKGTGRNGARSYLTLSNLQNNTQLEDIPIRPRSARKVGDLDDVGLYLNKKSNERLVLGSSLVPIPIIHHDLNDTVPYYLENQPLNYLNKNQSFAMKGLRKARVVGGEDGENGEWCWQVALINSLNQYLCSGALIGTFFLQTVMSM